MILQKIQEAILLAVICVVVKVAEWIGSKG